MFDRVLNIPLFFFYLVQFTDQNNPENVIATDKALIKDFDKNRKDFSKTWKRLPIIDFRNFRTHFLKLLNRT